MKKIRVTQMSHPFYLTAFTNPKHIGITIALRTSTFGCRPAILQSNLFRIIDSHFFSTFNAIGFHFYTPCDILLGTTLVNLKYITHTLNIYASVFWTFFKKYILFYYYLLCSKPKHQPLYIVRALI